MAGQNPINDINAQNKSLLAADSETDSETRRIQTETTSGKNYLLTKLGGTGVSGGQVDAHPVQSDGTTLVLTTGGQTGVKVMVVGDLNASGTSSVTSVASSATSVTLLALASTRKVATVYNDSTQILYLKFGATASATSHTVQIRAADYFEFPQPIYTGVVDGIWASANGSARITELT